MTSAASYTTASPPFNKPNADVILQSSNNVRFHVHTVVLSLASEFFESMFTLPQPTQKDVDTERGIPVIPVTEDADTLDHLLRFCYPVDNPIIPDVESAAAVAKAAMKYQMESAITLMTHLLQDFVKRHPLHVYVVACSIASDQLALEAALEWSRTSNIDSYISEMDHLSAAQYFQLLKSRHSGALASPGISFEEESISDSRSSWDTRRTTAVAPFNESAIGTDLILRSEDGVHFYVSRALLLLACTRNPSILDSSRTFMGGKPVVQLPEHSSILLKLLQLTYPLSLPALGNLEETTAIIDAAEKYGLTRASEIAKDHWRDYIESSPFQCYFIATARGWIKSAEMAMKHAAVVCQSDRYEDYMEGSSAEAYHQFLQYRQRCRQAICDVMIQYDSASARVGSSTALYWSTTVATKKGRLTPVDHWTIDGMHLLIHPKVNANHRWRWHEKLHSILAKQPQYDSSMPGKLVTQVRNIEDKIRSAFDKINREFVLIPSNRNSAH